MFIYLIVNRETGKYYVGQHKGGNLKKYLHQKFWEAKHQLSKRSYLYASIRKYGRDAFTIHALRSDIQTKTELDETERDFIRFLRSQDPEYGYNICRGGEGFTGPHSAEAKAKIRDSNIRTKSSSEYRAEISKTMEKMWADNPQSRIRVGESSKRAWSNPEFRTKVAKSQEWMWTDSEYLDKISAAGKRLWAEADPGKRARMINPAKEATKRRWAKYRKDVKDNKVAQVVYLHDEGMTTRAIGRKLGIGKSTVHSYLKVENDQFA